MRLRDVIKATLSRPVAFHAILGRVCGSATAGLMLSQAIYWSERTADPGGWFFKTQAEWEEEICLTRWEQETARRILRQKGFLAEERRGNPARLYYRVEIEAVARAVAQYAETQQSRLRKNHNLDCGKTSVKTAGNQQSLIGTETTAETTTEIPPLPDGRVPPGGHASQYQRFAQLWNQHCGKLPQVRELTKKRIEKLRARCRGKRAFEQDFIAAVQKAAHTPFLLGNNDRGWKASFDWLIENDTNHVRVLEGKYDGTCQGNRKPTGAYHGEPGKYADREPDLIVS